MSLHEDAELLLVNANDGSAGERVASAYLAADHIARETLLRWGIKEADTCADPVLAVCVIADGPHGPVDLEAVIKEFLEHRALGGTQG